MAQTVKFLRNLLYRTDKLSSPSQLILELTEQEKLQQTETSSSAELNSLSLHRHKAEVRTAEYKQKWREFYG
jgi:hypothetical protein